MYVPRGPSDAERRAHEFQHVTLFLRPLGIGLWSHGLSSALDLLNLCPVRRPLVSRLLQALGTTVSARSVGYSSSTLAD